MVQLSYKYNFNCHTNTISTFVIGMQSFIILYITQMEISNYTNATLNTNQRSILHLKCIVFRNVTFQQQQKTN